MSFITRINQLFSKPEPSGCLGISLQQDSLSYCYLGDDKELTCHHKNVLDNQYVQALKQIRDEKELSGVCHVVLSSKQNQLVQIDKPQIPAEEIGAALKWQIKDLVSIAPENMVVDYFDGVKLTMGAEKIHVVCADKNELTDIVAELNKHSVLIKSITIEEFAFVSLCPIQEEPRLLVCQQPNEDVLVLIIKDGSLYFQRRLRGLDQIASKSEDELNLGIIDSLSLEIQRSTDYFERQLKQPPIRNIDILVPMENEAFLARRLAENTHIPVNLFAMPEGYADFRQHAAAIGATMLNHMDEGA